MTEVQDGSGRASLFSSPVPACALAVSLSVHKGISWRTLYQFQWPASAYPPQVPLHAPLPAPPATRCQAFHFKVIGDKGWAPSPE